MTLDARKRRHFKRAMYMRVFLDGAELEQCVKADARRGRAWCYVVTKREHGGHVITLKMDEDTRELVIVQRYGKVTWHKAKVRQR